MTCDLRQFKLGQSLRILIILPLFFVLSTVSATSDDAKSQIEGVVSGQILAFKAMDHEKAFSYAAPSIKKFFQNEARFIQMVKNQYMPVYAPRSFKFGYLRVDGISSTIQVNIIGPNGNGWEAIYQLGQQIDGTWKIRGVYLRQRALGA